MDTLNINGQPANERLLNFAQRLVQTPSYSGEEGDAARLIAAEMQALNFDEVQIDRWGNVIGRIGSGGRSILFDSHTDTVKVLDEAEWDVPPFSGRIEGGCLWGRGSVDMKSGLAASVYAAAAARSQGWAEGKTVYVTGTVYEEYCDGEGLKCLLEARRLRPDFAVVCEPSSNLIATGHKGKVQAVIRTHGVAAHGSAPEKGVNAIYEMAEIIQRVEQTNLALMEQPGRHGTLVMSQIASSGVSINAVPALCEAYLDRRLAVGETLEAVRAELARLIAGKNAAWEVGTLHKTTWTGEPLTYEPLHAAWEISLEHELARACTAAYQDVFGKPPAATDFWDFSTNAVALAAADVPVIGFGPGEHKLAHMRNEKCAVSEIIDACAFYARTIARL